MLEAASFLSKNSEASIYPTWLGAHDFPHEIDRSQYIDDILTEQLPKVAEQGIAKWCDVFCEDGAFSVDESREILDAGKSLGFKLKIHADEFGCRTDVLEALSELEFTVMRYPGGNFVSNYHWRDGVGTVTERPTPR